MEIDFGVKKVWNDLVESKESLKSLYWLTFLMILTSVFDTVLKVNIFYSIVSMVLGAYFVLMVNNIIHDQKPVLENLSAQKGEGRNIVLVTLQLFGIGIVYGIALGIIGVSLYLIMTKLLMMNAFLALFLLIILLLPVLVLMSFCNLLFAERLEFGDAFNLKRAANSFKIGWKQYLAVFAINIFLVIGIIATLVVIFVPIVLLISLALNDYNFVTVAKNATSKHIADMAGKFIGALIAPVIGVMISYWFHNATGQIYKYTISQMNENN